MSTGRNNRTQRKRISPLSWQKLERLRAALRTDLIQIVLSHVESAPRSPAWASWAAFERFKVHVARRAGGYAAPNLRHRNAAALCHEIFLDEVGLTSIPLPMVRAETEVVL